MNAAPATSTHAPGGVDPASTPTAQFLYETLYGGAIGGSVIALFFLVLDSIGGRPMFTPSLIGEALFTGADPGSIAEVRLDMVAYFSVVHFAAFLVLGAVVSKMRAWTGRPGTSPLAVFALVFALLTGSFLAATVIASSGLPAAIGLWRVLAANALTAAAMSAFFYNEHRADQV